MEVIEGIAGWRARYAAWREEQGALLARDELGRYPFVENEHAPFAPLRRALPLVNLALITSAGAYVEGTEPFDTNAREGDISFREIPAEVEPDDLRFAPRGYDPSAVRQDYNSQVPLARLFEFEENAIIGQLNPAFWSFCGFIPDAARFAEESLPPLVERVKHYGAHAALLIPASLLCHQSMALAGRALEAAGIPTMMIAVEREMTKRARPPRAAYYREGRYGSVAGLPDWPEYQRRVLDEALRLIEPMDTPELRRIYPDLETAIQLERGER